MTGDDGSEDLAAIVEKPQTQAAIDALGEEGVYDSGRSVEPYDDGHVAIPVVEAPDSTTVVDVRPVELPRRERGLDDLLADRG
ncbi:MAG: class I SAM-dependent methyltransferase family protein, partial [Natronomonas sp.]